MSEFGDPAPAAARPSTLEKEQEKKMTDILTEVGLGSDVIQRFSEEKVYPPTVILLSDKQLQELGVLSMGERASLKALCKRVERCQTISEEVERIMAPYGGQLPMSSNIQLSNVKSTKRRQKKGSFASVSKKGKHVMPPQRKKTFQKKIVVIKYMGESSPRQFTLKDNIVVMRGLLPDIDLQASEDEVRTAINSVIVNSGDELSSCTRFGFEFIEATGKTLYAPAKPPGFQWSGKAVKNLAGNGQVYVRLLFDPDSSSSESDFPSFEVNAPSTDHSSDVTVVKVEPGESTQQTTAVSSHSKTCGQASAPLTRLPPHSRVSRTSHSEDSLLPTSSGAHMSQLHPLIPHSTSSSSPCSSRLPPPSGPTPTQLHSRNLSSSTPPMRSQSPQPSTRLTHPNLTQLLSHSGPTRIRRLPRSTQLSSDTTLSQVHSDSGPVQSHSDSEPHSDSGPHSVSRPAQLHTDSGLSQLNFDSVPLQQASQLDSLSRHTQQHSLSISGSGPSQQHSVSMPSPSGSGLSQQHSVSMPSPSGPGPSQQHSMSMPSPAEAGPSQQYSVSMLSLAEAGPSLQHSVSMPSPTGPGPSQQHSMSVPSPSGPGPSQQHSVSVLSLTEAGPSLQHSASSTQLHLQGSGIMQLGQMFPLVSEECIRFIYKVSNEDLLCAADCILSGPSLETLVPLIRNTVISSESDGKLRIDEDEQEGEELADCIFAFYKGCKFQSQSSVRMCIKGQPAVDTGGVRRQVFSQFFETVAFSDRLCLFDGPPHRRRPAFRISSLTSGMMKILGRIIGHSIVLDCQGFPYLSPVCYSIMTGNLDQALLLCSSVDASERVQRVLEEFSMASTIDELGETKDTILDLMDQSGCDIPLKIEMKASISEALYRWDAIQKRKPFLDQLTEGLEEFQLATAIRLFPDVFRSLFLSDNQYKSQAVIDILHPKTPMTDEEEAVYAFLMKFITECSHSELQDFLCYTTGSPHIQGNKITVNFDHDAFEFTVSTCSKTLSISPRIKEYEPFATALHMLINSKQFTMP